MPADRFPFPVRVCREINLGGVSGFFTDFSEDFPAAADRYVFQVKIMIHIHAELTFGKITHMPLRGFHLISFSKIFTDCFGFCR